MAGGRPKGHPKTGGRKIGSRNRATAKREAEIAASGLTPLQFLLDRLRNTKLDADKRVEAAKAAAPYVHPRLNAVDHTDDVTLRFEDKLDELE